MGGTAAQPRDIEQLRAWAAAGRPVRYLHFWGHRPASDGSVGRGCLSQWWPVTFTVDGVSYASAEHYMMAAKARLFGDSATEQRILASTSPATAKRLGRQVSGFDEDRWVAERFAVVEAASLAKFGQHPDLRAYLLGTAGDVLVEASPTDRVWGIGLAADDPGASDPAQWRGLNLLGFALMAARERLAAEESPVHQGT